MYSLNSFNFFSDMAGIIEENISICKIMEDKVSNFKDIESLTDFQVLDNLTQSLCQIRDIFHGISLNNDMNINIDKKTIENINLERIREIFTSSIREERHFINKKIELF